MATVTSLGQTWNTTSGTHTVVITPTVGDLIVLTCASTGNTSTTAPTDNNPDGLGTYTLITTAVKATSADTMKMWVRNYLIGSASSTTFTHAPGTSTGGGLHCYGITGMERTGLSGAVRQSGKQDNQAAAGTPAVALGVGAALTGNAMIGAIFNATNPAGVTQPTSWASSSNTGYNSPTTGINMTKVNSGFTGSTVTWGSTSASAFCSIAAEFDTTPAPRAILFRAPYREAVIRSNVR